MSIRVKLHHKTEYIYEKPVSIFPHVIRLRPAVHTRTPVLSYSLNVLPKKHFLNWQQDPFGNYQARFVFLEKSKELSFEVDLTADMTVINPFDFFLEPNAERFPFKYDDGLKLELLPYLYVNEESSKFNDFAASVPMDEKRSVDFLVEINQIVHKHVDYIIRMEPGVQTPEETLKIGKGSCRDSAWLLVQTLRKLGLAARFVSGYLIQLTADVKPLDGPAGPSEDFTDLHAWTEVYLPGAGWVGLDPTSGLFAGEGHIPLACTPEPAGAAPLTGATEKADVKFNYEMSVTRIQEKPRTTKPYTEGQWGKIYSLGAKIDSEMKETDVRLTMGGEPTFVSALDMDGAEWNTEALGPTKKKYALDLLHRLKGKWGFGPLLHFGQGKWYPGESLPRWALACIWRKDGIPVWRDQALIADENLNLGMDHKHAYEFIKTLTSFLNITDRYVVPGYEDVYYYLWKEGTLPVNVDPFKKNLKDSEERKTLRKVLEQGLDKIAGFGLPLRWNSYESVWETGPRNFRRDRMYLIPGDSPMGYRLPLSSIPHSESYTYAEEPSSFEPKVPLKDFHFQTAVRAQRYFRKTEHSGRISSWEWAEIQRFGYPENREISYDYENIIRTTLCVEPRGGNLYVFIPPLARLEEYLELISCIELASAMLEYPVMIEGYLPPYDSRINKFMITPDPGVIEVNIHPASDFNELVRNTEILYEEARNAKLSTEKFMMDGRHTGTGGGNHVTLGAAYPSDSPFLRRPDLLKSLLAYWQNHPSLSYLFSGLFIGPTSQAPRIDEARNDSLNELEIAFQQVKRGNYTPLWMVDRIFRNILTDVTGNTHRAEFSIDKLYSPDGAQGRLGLLEMRALEMPPHYRMSIAQMLLVRSLVSRFWKNPYERKLVRFGTELHDKYMLPHYVWADFKDVIYDLNRNGYEFSEEWFEVFRNFRFPLLGVLNSNDIRLELRTAIEPWHVMGEEGTSGGTARYVDSSVERIEIKVFGLTDSRHIVLCNGRPVPLRPTGVNGEFAAGVRFKAWQPYSALHPHIGVHGPLVFDIYDTWNEQSVGGCTYHISHPGGRSYDTFPVNGNEAESRRISRFFTYGHTPGRFTVPPVYTDPEFPYTLDLRKNPV
ncbi:MAG TPA: transglutaminase family protein [Leptospiraceae bacterium]|nr:transglutaminase family protein [Leptospiraceae bacterium]